MFILIGFLCLYFNICLVSETVIRIKDMESLEREMAKKKNKSNVNNW